uniref:Bm13369 n=1 Tax=Brugia malayi TaxID=6279 RepID=A0A1I9G021_BRUMA|nr:Bm13369 [Brugia malayi]
MIALASVLLQGDVKSAESAGTHSWIDLHWVFHWLLPE